jgi:hypothetical protein
VKTSPQEQPHARGLGSMTTNGSGLRVARLSYVIGISDNDYGNNRNVTNKKNSAGCNSWSKQNKSNTNVSRCPALLYPKRSPRSNLSRKSMKSDMTKTREIERTMQQMRLPALCPGVILCHLPHLIVPQFPKHHQHHHQEQSDLLQSKVQRPLHKFHHSAALHQRLEVLPGLLAVKGPR